MMESSSLAENFCSAPLIPVVLSDRSCFSDSPTANESGGEVTNQAQDVPSPFAKRAKLLKAERSSPWRALSSLYLI
ncbi:hypothetical protein [Roseovarius sp. 2305UL8-3]|uniref:hypothetical protein n=1 Tax=Roseovarius conchicola TaxID=3121636 RepID=UPI003527DCD2